MLGISTNSDSMIPPVALVSGKTLAMYGANLCSLLEASITSFMVKHEVFLSPKFGFIQQTS
ncbi:hypothetical protein RV08_GL000206 [Enterococcus mundtii]|nr:hypothetical protein RV08_GL000206 [Enterococcus mundtii]